MTQLADLLTPRLPAGDAVHVSLEHAEDGFFYRPASGTGAPESAGAAADGGLHLFTLRDPRQPALVRADHGPFTTRQSAPVPLPLEVANITDPVHFHAAAPRVSAHLVTQEVTQERPVLRVLMAAAPAGGGSTRPHHRTLCVTVMVRSRSRAAHRSLPAGRQRGLSRRGDPASRLVASPAGSRREETGQEPGGGVVPSERRWWKGRLRRGRGRSAEPTRHHGGSGASDARQGEQQALSAGPARASGRAARSAVSQDASLHPRVRGAQRGGARLRIHAQVSAAEAFSSVRVKF